MVLYGNIEFNVPLDTVGLRHLQFWSYDYRRYSEF